MKGITSRWWFRLGLGLFVIGLVWLSYRIVVRRQLRTDLDRAREDMAAGRLSAASTLLTRLEKEWAGQAEVEYQLGVCEQARGRRDAALAAWGRVPAGRSEFSALAAAGRASLLIDMGRHTPAEASLDAVAGAQGPGAVEVRRVRSRLLRLEMRLDELRRLLEQSWNESPDPAATLAELWVLDGQPFPIEGVRRVLDVADPDDDRVWLGRANLAVRSGECAAADQWLTKCEQRRPNDLAVARGRLNWALACQNVEAARCASLQLPADAFSTTEALRLRAFFAASRSDVEGERRAFEDLVEQGAGSTPALERLIEMAVEAGRHDEAARLRKRKDELAEARERYRKLLASGRGTADHFDELAQLATTLGRYAEARGWSSLSARDRPDSRGLLARPNAAPTPAARSGRTLADAVGNVPPATGAPAATPSGRASTIIPAFTDDAETAGLNLIFNSGRSALRQLPETMSGGVGVLDYDGDGWLDVYALQGGTFPPETTGESFGDRLFRNRGDSTFEDATSSSGLARMTGGYGHGVAVGDYDNDGRPDLFVTRWRSYALYRNRGDGTFEDATARAGLAGDRDWPTSAAWADLDNDGDLDLYVCHYLKWDADNPRQCHDPQARVNKYCDPREFEALPDHLFRNDGGRFVDVTAEAGIVDADGRGLGVVAADVDDDGKVDLFVANDTSANYFFHNLGGLRFEETGHAAGLAGNAQGGYLAGMGIACGDLDGDALVDLAVTNFYNESMTVYHNLGGGFFSDRGGATGAVSATRYLLGFGISMFDGNNDGRLDVMTANGHVNDSRPYFPYAMPAQLLLGEPRGRLVDVSPSAGPPWKVPRVGRGLATGDLDNDGHVDALLTALDEPLAYFHNQTRGEHFLTLRLEGAASNRDSVGARVAVVAGGRRHVAQRLGGGSYLSACDGRLHFGLGAADRVNDVEVRWPSGKIDQYHDLAADTGYHIREGDAVAHPLQGFARPR